MTNLGQDPTLKHPTLKHPTLRSFILFFPMRSCRLISASFKLISDNLNIENSHQAGGSVTQDYVCQAPSKWPILGNIGHLKLFVLVGHYPKDFWCFESMAKHDWGDQCWARSVAPGQGDSTGCYETDSWLMFHVKKQWCKVNCRT